MNVATPAAAAADGESMQHCASVDSVTATAHMCAYCFDVLCRELGEKHIATDRQLPALSLPLFVTWMTGAERKLRGCIGTFEPQPLSSGLREFTVSSAFHDRRFSPISASELSQLAVTVSLLVAFEPAADYRDWDIGRHGIRIAFRQSNRDHSATYLPQVALEQGWDHVATIDSLLRKGGWRGAVSESDRRRVRVTRYQSRKHTLTYSDYLLM